MSHLDPLILALANRGTKVPATFRLGEVTSITGGLFVKFDGETAASTKSYPKISTFAPAVADRVLLARVGSTWVVIGAIL